MKIQEKLSNINNVFVFNQNLLLIKETEFFIDKNNYQKNEDDCIFISNNYLFMVRENVLYQCKHNSFQLISKEYTNIYLKNDEVQILTRINDDFPVKTLFKTDNCEFSFEGLFSILYCNDSRIHLYNSLSRKEIKVINKEGIQLNNYLMPENFKIYLKPEVIGNILYFTAYNEHQKNQLVTGLDIETGAIVWQHMYEVTSANKFISAPAFNEKDQLFYGIGHIYQVFNPKTGEIILEKIFDECKNYNLLVDAQAIYDNKLWFVSGGGKNTKFGYVNIDTHQLEFIQDLPHEEYEVFDIPVFHEGKLYLRGKHQNNLYIFE